MLEPSEGQEVRFVCPEKNCGHAFWHRWCTGDSAKGQVCFMHEMLRPEMEMTEIRDVTDE